MKVLLKSTIKFACIFALMANIALAKKQLIDGVAAIIGSDVITFSEVAMVLELEKKLNSKVFSQQKNGHEALDELFNQAVLANYARNELGKQNLSETLVKKEISILSQSFGAKENFESFVLSHGGSQDLIRRLIRRRLLAKQVLSLKPSNMSKADWIKKLKEKVRVRKLVKTLPETLAKMPSSKNYFG